MHDAHDFLTNLALVLCVAAATTIVFQRLRQPVVFGYLLAGMIVGPHVPIPVAVDERMVQTLAETGVVLLMFGLGLEFSLRKLIQVGPTAGIVALIQCSAMVWFGFLLGRLFGWTTLESIYAGAVIAISSTTIIVKAFAEQGVRGRFTEMVFGILIIEDLIGIFLIAILTTLSTGGGVSAGSLAGTAGRLAMFLAALLGVGLLLVPRLIRAVVKLERPETTLVASVGVCFAAALFALQFGYSVALGAFIAGSLVAESGHAREVEHVVHGVRDLFGAIFFVAVGMMIDPRLIAEHWPAVIAFTAVVVAGKLLAVTVGAFLSGYDVRTSTQAGMSLAQIGEFSFIIAGVGLTTGATRNFLYPVAVAVSAITTLTTPLLIRASGPVASWVDRRLPHPLQTFVGLYGAWIERLRSGPEETGYRAKVRRKILLLVVDAALLAGVTIGTALESDLFSRKLADLTGLTDNLAQLVVLVGAAAVAIPLLIGVVRVARALGLFLAARALPEPEDRRSVDLAAAPRRVLVVTLQLGILTLVGIPLMAVTQPFLPFGGGTVVLLVVLGALAVAFWRHTADLHGHTRAGAQVILAALARQMAPAQRTEEMLAVDSPGWPDDEPMALRDDPAAARLSRALGLGEPVAMRVAPSSSAAGRTLAQLDVRGLTGATVLAITRNGDEVVLPVGREVLRAGDILAVGGTADAIRAARTLLGGEGLGQDTTATTAETSHH